MSRRVRGCAAAASVLAVLATAAPAGAGAITFSTALPVSAGRAVLRLQLAAMRSGDDPSGARRDLELDLGRVVLAYGASERWTLFAAVPVRRARLAASGPAGRVRRDASGLGDLRLVARYTVVQRDTPGATTRLAPFLGVELPTGDADRGDSLGRLPPPLQPGSGSVDVVGGIALSHQTLAWEGDAAVAYVASGAGDWFDPGDMARLDLSYQRRVAPRRLGPGVPAFLYAVLESNLIWQGRRAVAGVEDPGSGGTRWFLAPGLQYVTRTFVVEGVVQLPVVQNLGPGALETGFVATIGVRIYL